MHSTTRRKVLERVLSGPNDAGIIDEALGRAERIIETRASLEKRRDAALQAYRREVQDVDGLLDELQRQCQHPATTDEDATLRCDLCCAEFR